MAKVKDVRGVDIKEYKGISTCGFDFFLLICFTYSFVYSLIHSFIFNLVF